MSSSYHTFAASYDSLTYNVDYAHMADRLCSLIDQHGGRRGLILDLGCGTGSLMAELVKRGSDVIGADASAEMLAAARERLPQALLLCQPMQKLDLYGTVDTVVCTLDSLNHLLTRRGMEQAVARAGLFLEPGGLFLFDVNTPYKHESVLANNVFVYDRPDVYCVWQNRLRHLTVDIRLDLFSRDGDTYTRRTESFSERAYTQEELLAAITAAGLELVARYDGYEDREAAADSERVLYVTRRIRPYGENK